MNDTNPEQVSDPEEYAAGSGVVAAAGVSPYATGGGGVTFERRVAVQYLAHLLVGDGASELGGDFQVVSVAFQQAPGQPVDDLVVNAARLGELQPSLELALGVRRSPRLVLSDESTRKLIRQFVSAVIKAPTEGPESRLGLVVAGPQPHAEQLAHLAGLAMAQMDAPGFFDLVRTPGKVNAGVRKRLDHLEELVERALHDLGVTEADTSLVQQRVWQVLARLTVCMPRLESPDESDWSTLTNSLIPIARGSDLTGASRLRDRLFDLASEYSPKSAQVDLPLLRRDAHTALDPTVRRHQLGWRTLDHLHTRALASVGDEITASDDARRVRLDRRTAAGELLATAASAPAVVVSGDSGVGKSALALLGLTAAADPVNMQMLCINLRQVPKLTVQFEKTLGCPLSTLLSELSASRRMLVVDGADAVVEGWGDAFRHVVGAAQESGVKVIAVASIDSKEVVQDTVTEKFSTGVKEHTVLPLMDTEIEELVKTFGELRKLYANPRSRELLRRLVVVDLLVRGGVQGVPLSDADALREVWSGLVRRREVSVRGFPDARELVLLRLAALSLNDVDADGRLDVISGLDGKALAGLRQDGLLRTSSDDPFMIGPDFAHDEVRRYAVARFLLADRDPASSAMRAGVPRWSLAAARLACEELLSEPDTPSTPLRGRFDALQASFDAIVEAGHGTRWGDVPSEALITLANPDAVLRDAWPSLLADDASGSKRLARLVNQRLSDDTDIVEVIAVEPIISRFLKDHAPWLSGEHAQGLLRKWLRAHVLADTGAGHPLRIRLRERLADACAEADHRLAEERDAVAAGCATQSPEETEQQRRITESYSRFSSEIGGGGRPRRQRREVPYEITNKIFIELLALLGPDLGNEGEAILRRIALDAPWWLAPAVGELFTGRALATYHPGLLARLTEAYYLDDEPAGSSVFDDGVRSHRSQEFGLVPLGAWYRGPFMPLVQSDFRNGVAVVNRLLNHAARIRARTLADLRSMGQLLEDQIVGPFRIELKITGARRTYVGDEHVWRWHRGSGVGPYPCISALQAVEHVCDKLIEAGTPIRTLVSMLLDGCESLAMVSLVVGLLVRHLEGVGRLLDPYLVEPVIWLHEFARVANETQRFAVDPEELVSPERRGWSLREAAMFMCVRANAKRAAELRTLGETLVANARLQIESNSADEPTEPEVVLGDSIEQQLATVRAWASSLDRDTYEAHETPDGLHIQSTPPDDIVKALQSDKEDLERVQESTRLVVRYLIKPTEKPAEAIGADELAADLATSRKLLESPPSRGIHDPWDVSALVAAAALEASLLGGADLPDDALSFAADTVLRIGKGEAGPRPYEIAQTLFERGADRSAARALPLLLLPVAAPLRAVVDRADGRTTFERAACAGVKLAHAVAGEVRLQLGRGLDRFWETPCVEKRGCHHEIGLRLATETMRDCVLGTWDPDTERRNVVMLDEPITQSLADTNDGSIIAFRLDAAIRALAPATVANICVSERARVLLLALLAAQRRSLLSREGNELDGRGSHTLVSARALLTLAQRGDDSTIHEHIDAFSGNSALLDTLLRALSAAAEETQDRASTARRIWPKVVRHVLDLLGSVHAPVQDDHYGNMALAALMPVAASETKYLYREVQDSPILWWEPLALRPEVKAWLPVAAGRAECVDQLIRFLSVLASEDQIRTGLTWIAALVLANPVSIARQSFLLPTWLIDGRGAAERAGRSASWQEVVDALVVAGVTRLAPYSE